MKRRYKATGVAAQPGGLVVYVTVEVGSTIRFIEVKVPWETLEPAYEVIANAIETQAQRDFLAAWDAAQPRLPGID